MCRLYLISDTEAHIYLHIALKKYAIYLFYSKSFIVISASPLAELRFTKMLHEPAAAGGGRDVQEGGQCALLAVNL